MLVPAIVAGTLVPLAPWLTAEAQVRRTGRAVSIPLPQGRPEVLKVQEPVRAPDRGGEPSEAPALCRARFLERGGIALPVDNRNAGGECAIGDAVTFRTIAMPDGSKVELDAAITVGCAFALEFLEWVRADLAGILAARKGKLARLTSVGGQACRPRNGVAGASISEHATGNAVDLGGLVMQDGTMLRLTEAGGDTRALREAVRHSACRRFATVLGPGSDSAHKDHIHLDMRKRNRDYRICQWVID